MHNLCKNGDFFLTKTKNSRSDRTLKLYHQWSPWKWLWRCHIDYTSVCAEANLTKRVGSRVAHLFRFFGGSVVARHDCTGAKGSLVQFLSAKRKKTKNKKQIKRESVGCESEMNKKAIKTIVCQSTAWHACVPVRIGKKRKKKKRKPKTKKQHQQQRRFWTTVGAHIASTTYALGNTK